MSDRVRPLVVVWWKDHVSHESAEWQEWPDAEACVREDMPTVMSVGFLYHENREALSLVSTVGDYEHGGGLRLLKKVIVRQVRLDPPGE